MVGMVFSLIFNEARRIWCYRWLAAATTAILFGLAALYIFSMPNVYDGWGQVFVADKGPLGVAAQGVSLDKDDKVDLVVQKTLLNDQNLEKVVRQTNPAAKTMNQSVMNGAIGALKSKISIVSDPDSGFIEFHYTNKDPAKARDVARTLMDQFITENVSRTQNNLGQTSKFLDDQIASYEKTMLNSQVAMADFRRQHPAVARLPMTGSTAADLIGAGATGGESAGGGSRVVYSSPGGAGPAGAPAVVTAPQDGPLAELEGQLATLRTQYTDQYPDVVSTRRQIANLQADRARYLSTIAAAPAAARVAAGPTRQRTVIAGGGGGARSVAVSIAPDVLAQWAELRRKDELLATNYQQLIAKREATKMSQAMNETNSGKYQVTRTPVLPTEPTGPNRTLFLSLALLVAICAGLGAAYVRGAINGIFVSPKELEETFQLPVVGTVSWEPAWHTGVAARAGRTLPIFVSIGFLIVVALAFLVAR